MNAARPPQSLSLGATTVPADTRSAPSGAPASPPARRTVRPSWRDPRLLVGVVIVAVCVLLGARLLATADDTVAVWTARGDLAAGTQIGAGDLSRSEVRFTSRSLAGRYLSAERVPAGAVLLHDVASGELVPRSALGSGEGEDLAELPIALPAEAVPDALRHGQVVDVWVTPTGDAGGSRPAVRVLEAVPVLAAPQSTSALGPSTSRQVVVGVPPGDDDVLARALAALADGTAVLVRRS